MERFASNMKRKLKALSKPRASRSRSAKLRQLARQAGEDISLKDILSASVLSSETEGVEHERHVEQVFETNISAPEASSSAIEPDGGSRSPDWATVDEEQSSIGSIPDVPGSDAINDEPIHEDLSQNNSAPEAPMALDPHEAQLLRNQVYYLFEYEDASDYTEGPCRLADATDGVKDCAALLMTLSLSAKIQEAVKAQRAFAKAKRSASNKKLACLRLRSTLNAEIANRKNQIKKGVEDDAQLECLEEQQRNLEQMLEGNRVEEQLIKNSLENDGQRLLRTQEQAMAEIEEAFVAARLLESVDDTPDTPVEDLDLDQEYQKFVHGTAGLNNGNDGSGSPSYSSDRSYTKEESLTPEEQRKEELKDTVWTAQQRYDIAQAIFDRREADRTNEYLANAEAFDRGEATTDASPEEFDLRWVRKIQKMTHELIEAESALSAARAAAIEAGIDIPMDDRASGFVDDAADGYRMSMEQAMISSAPSPKIRDWMSGIPEVASPSFNEHSEEADEWEAEEVEMCDSLSMIAQDAGERRRIDKWQQECKLK